MRVRDEYSWVELSFGCENEFERASKHKQWNLMDLYLTCRIIIKKYKSSLCCILGWKFERRMGVYIVVHQAETSNDDMESHFTSFMTHVSCVSSVYMSLCIHKNELVKKITNQNQRDDDVMKMNWWWTNTIKVHKA